MTGALHEKRQRGGCVLDPSARALYGMGKTRIMNRSREPVVSFYETEVMIKGVRIIFPGRQALGCGWGFTGRTWIGRDWPMQP